MNCWKVFMVGCFFTKKNAEVLKDLKICSVRRGYENGFKKDYIFIFFDNYDYFIGCLSKKSFKVEDLEIQFKNGNGNST